MVDNKESQIATEALKDLRVLDLSEFVSGPYCTKMLAAFGAEVLKIEKPQVGDGSRMVGPFLNDEFHPERSALYLYLNTNKKSITLNLKTRMGIDIFKKLVHNTDVIVENYPPGYMSSLGLDYETLENINPRLVMVSITDFGQTGPYRNYKSGRLVGYAMSGYMYLNGDPDREPLSGGGEQPAYQGGLHAYAGTMAALISRENSGQGQYIDISIMECMTSIHQFNINRYVYSKSIQKRIGNRYMSSHPITIYPCKDGCVSICPATDDQTENMLIMMGMKHLLEDPRFRTGVHRLVYADEFDEIVKPWFLERGKKEILESCQEWRVPAAYVNTVKDLLQDPQYIARNFWINLNHPEAGMLPYPAGPFKMSETPARLERAPLLGEHNVEIFRSRLGFSKEDFDILKSKSVI